MSGFDPTNPFASAAPTQQPPWPGAAAGAAPVANPFASSDPFAASQQQGAGPFESGPARQRSATSPFVASFPPPPAQSSTERRTSESAAAPAPWSGSSPFASTPAAPPAQQSVFVPRPSDPFVTTPFSTDPGDYGRPRAESVTVFRTGSQGGGRRASKDLDEFDPLAQLATVAPPATHLPPVPEVNSSAGFAAAFPAPASQPAGAPPPVPQRSPATERPLSGVPSRPSSKLNDPDSQTSVVSQALEKYSIDAVLQGLPTAQTMVVGSTHNEEKLDEAYGKGDRQFVGYRGYVGYERIGFSAGEKREFRVRKSPQSAIRITLKQDGISICRCPTGCDASHVEVSFIPYADLVKLRHIQTDSKKGYHYLALETADTGVFVIYSQETKMIKAGINTRFKAARGSVVSRTQSANLDAQEPEPKSTTGSSAFDDPFAGATKAPPPPAAQDEWWK